MITLDFINDCLNCVGEQQLISSAGDLGSMVRTFAQAALNKVVQESRASFFEARIGLTGTVADYLVPIGQLPEQALQIQRVLYNSGYSLYELPEVPFDVLAYNLAYSVLGVNFYLTSQLARPVTVSIDTTLIPVIPTDDAATLPLPQPAIAAVKHQTAALLLSSYVDDAAGAAVQQKMADTLILNLRNVYGRGRGRSFNMAGRGNF